MRTETITQTFELFTYEELSDDAKEDAKRKYLEDSADILCYCFDEWVKDELHRVFPNSSLDVEFSFSYSQGDGLNIYGKTCAEDMFNCVDSFKNIDVLEKFKNTFTEEEKQTLIAYGEDCEYIDIPGNKMGYTYCYADRIDFADDWAYDLELAGRNENDIDTELLKRFEAYTKEVFTHLCGKYEEWGYEEMYEISDERMMEMCADFNWEFLADGTIY